MHGSTPQFPFSEKQTSSDTRGWEEISQRALSTDNSPSWLEVDILPRIWPGRECRDGVNQTTRTSDTLPLVFALDYLQESGAVVIYLALAALVKTERGIQGFTSKCVHQTGQVPVSHRITITRSVAERNCVPLQTRRLGRTILRNRFGDRRDT